MPLSHSTAKDRVIPPERRSNRLQAKSSLRGLQDLDHQDEDHSDYPARRAVANSDGDDDETVFKARPSLPRSVVNCWKLTDLVENIEKGLIDLNPEYQRDVVWIQKSMSYLINSLIEDFYIPPLIFNKHIIKQPDGTEKYMRICIDGKQRLTSIHKFMSGQIPCHDRRGKTWFYCQPVDENGQVIVRGSKQKKLRIWSEELRREFNSKSLVSYEFKDLNSIQEEDLFARVQKGMPLTAAEKLQASTGPWQTLAKEVERDYVNVVSLSSQNRGTGFRNLLTAFAQIVEVQDGGSKVRIQAQSVTTLVTKEQALCSNANKSHLRAVFKKFSDLINASPRTFQNNNYKIARNFAPFEIVAVAVLISLYMDTRNDNMLIGDIEAMRSTIREHLPDLRMDHITWKSTKTFIFELESFRGTTETSTIAKKTFTPSKVSEQAKARFRVASQYRTNMEIQQNSETRVINSASTEVSARSTPATSLGQSASSATSHRSRVAEQLLAAGPEFENSRESSPSVDSVLGEDFGSPYEPAESAFRTTSVVVPVLSPIESASTRDALSYAIYGDSTTSIPGLKIDGTDSGGVGATKRALSSNDTSRTPAILDESRAQRAKRVRLDLSRKKEG